MLCMKCLLSILLIFIALFLTACTTKRAVVDGGSIQAYMPTPNKGLGAYIDKDTTINRVQMGIRTFDKETMPLSGLSNDANFLESGSPKYNTAADIRYRLIRFPVTLTVDIFEKRKSFMYKTGFGLDPYPYVDVTFAHLERFLEFGIAVNVGLAFEQEKLKGSCITVDHTLVGDMDWLRDCEWDGEWKITGALEGYLNIFPLKNIALTYSFTYFYPQLFDNVDGYYVSFDFPPILMNYLGASYLFAEHYQVSAGAILYLDSHLKQKFWYVDTSIGYLF